MNCTVVVLTHEHLFKILRHDSCSFFSSIPGKTFGASLSASLDLVLTLYKVNSTELITFFRYHSLSKSNNLDNFVSGTVT